LRGWCGGRAARGFLRSAGVFLGAARSIFLGAGFFFDASRGFFGRGAYHQRLAFAFIPLALRFHAAVFFQHALAHGQFCLGQGAACAGSAGLARTLTAIIASLRAR